MTPGRVLARICVFAPAGLLAYAGVLKLSDPSGLLDALRTYRIFPYGVMVSVALLVPWLEIAAGVAVLSRTWRPAGAALAALLLSGFLLGIAQAWARGLLVNCGCFGTGVTASQVDYALLVGRNVLLLASLGVWWRFDGPGKARQSAP